MKLCATHNTRENSESQECPLCRLDEVKEVHNRHHCELARKSVEALVALEQQNEALASRLGAAEKAMREVVSYLRHSQRGSTHWAGCPDVHPACQAIDMLVDALALESRDVETPDAGDDGAEG